METIDRALSIPVSTHTRGAEVALAQRLAFVRQLEALTPQQWDAPTECTRWTVRDIVAHMAGELDYCRNPLAYTGLVVTWLRHFRELNFLDGTNEAAVHARREWTVERLLDEFRRDVPRAVPPPWSRRLPLMGAGGLPRTATFSYLTDVVLPRDAWMHRHDIARATGQTVVPDSSDGEIVAQVVRDLALNWSGPDAILTLTGSGGGTWLLGSGDASPGTQAAEVAAVGFLRRVSGRASEVDLLANAPEPLRTSLESARVLF
ncbi:MAG TPA: maleylpyruvate isomerase family mycothiol-dependent enzyme [Propionibacteriaceae bacterium]|nr:maleylpyruvate isomerase family mycothiol-dependent enzyme [Propionibacteriaceae bacterium]